MCYPQPPESVLGVQSADGQVYMERPHRVGGATRGLIAEGGRSVLGSSHSVRVTWT